VTVARQSANLIDRLLAPVAPRWARDRARARREFNVLAYYEAADANRLRKQRLDAGSGDAVVNRAGPSLRAYARHLDENHDLARGALNVLVANVVGPAGIVPEPQPRRADGTIHDAFAAQLLELWRDWSPRCDVTWQLDWPMAQRLAARTWLRDGEALAQHLEGTVPQLDHGTRVPYSIELIEPDLLPLDYHDASRGITAGVERNAWGRPRTYWLHRQHPGALLQTAVASGLKPVPAERVKHMKMVDRIGQARGVSVFASVLGRLDDLKDYEESERIAAKVAASMCAAIIKGAPDDYPEPIASADGTSEPRHMMMRPGMIFDDLKPGESVESLAANRPNPAAGAWRDDQLRAVSAGVGAGYSSLARRYEGTYNARRQEQVETWRLYEVLQDQFVAQFVRPVWERFVRAAILSGAVRVPPDVVPDTADDALYQGPVMPALDPLKEVNANIALQRAGYESGPAIIRALGGNPRETLQQERNWREQCAAAGVLIDTDPANDMGPPAPAPEPPDPDAEDDDQADTPPAAARGRWRTGAAHG
jgi:lambda family phage portal protein